MSRIVLFLTLAPAQAGAFSLELPIDCALGDTCHIQQYVDRDGGPGHSDFTCGPLSYDGHTGTDFALPTLAAMRQGVTVRASASGIVRAVRDGLPDIAQNDANAPDLQGRDCGNGLVIDHGMGWETQYCHMAKDSLLPKPGDIVTAGQALGLVGLSGNTEFPHLHLSVRKDGAEIDPFDPDGTATCGPGPDAALWVPPLPYTPGGLLGIGLAPDVPEWAAIKAGLPSDPLPSAAPALVIWAHFFGNQAGDTLDLAINAPDGGQIIADSITLDRTQAQAFRAIGKRLRGVKWPVGTYTLTARLRRGGTIVDSSTATARIYQVDATPLPP